MLSLVALAFSHSLAGSKALGPAEADFVEIQVGKLRADVMKSAGDSSPDPSIEPFNRIDVDGIPDIFAEWSTVSCATKLSPMATNAFASSLIKCA